MGREQRCDAKNTIKDQKRSGDGEERVGEIPTKNTSKRGEKSDYIVPRLT